MTQKMFLSSLLGKGTNGFISPFLRQPSEEAAFAFAVVVVGTVVVVTVVVVTVVFFESGNTK